MKPSLAFSVKSKAALWKCRVVPFERLTVISISPHNPPPDFHYSKHQDSGKTRKESEGNGREDGSPHRGVCQYI